MTIKTTSFTHRPRVALARFSFCWWRHNRLLMTSQWPDNCHAITWVVISNSLDIDFIHGDIHGRLCIIYTYIYIYSNIQSHAGNASVYSYADIFACYMITRKYFDKVVSVSHIIPFLHDLHSLQLRHNECECVSNDQPHCCLLNLLFRRRSKENIKAPRHWPLRGEFTGNRWIPCTNGQ